MVKRWKTSAKRLPSLAGLLVFLGVLFTGAGSVRGLQGGEILRVDEIDPRPVGKAVCVLEQRHGWIVTYEDPRYEHEREVQDVTAQLAKNYTPDKPRMIIPRGGPFSFSYELRRGGTPSDGLEVLQTMLSAHETSGNGGIFRIEQDSNIFHVVPVAVKNTIGQLVEQRSILEARLTLPEAERTGFELVKAVLEVVHRALGNKVNAVNIGTFATNPQRRFRGGFANVSARDVLVRTLMASGGKQSWRLLYDPGRREYTFNVHGVNTPRSP